MTIFYKKNLTTDSFQTLDEGESKHCAQVLRHQVGDEIAVFDGNGTKCIGKLTSIKKNACEFEVISTEKTKKTTSQIHLGIAPTKNMDRMEWLVEKLCEIGVDEVSLIYTQHSERRKIRLDRLEKKAVSAMKQSGNPFKIQINEAVSLPQFIENLESETNFICYLGEELPFIGEIGVPNSNTTVLIGPEGDFSVEEIQLVKENGFKGASLGDNVLRTETAGLIACCYINFLNQK